MPLALITGGSLGLGRQLALQFAARGHDLILTARHGQALDEAALTVTSSRAIAGRRHGCSVEVVAGDVSDPVHRDELVRLVAGRPLDVLVNNASTLGPTPLRPLTTMTAGEIRRTVDVNTIAPVALVGALLPALSLAERPVVVNVSSDAAVEAYEGWGTYGLAKAALDHATAVLAVEHPDITFHAVDPGDMNTAMHHAAVPDADPADLSDAADVALIIADLIESSVGGGRVRVADLASRSVRAFSS